MIRLRPALAGIPDYVPGRSAASVAEQFHLSDVVKLASNEAPFAPSPPRSPPSPRLRPASTATPMPTPSALRRALADHCGVDIEQVLVGNGSVELCRMACAATADPGDEIVYAWPSFEAYPILVQQAGATSVRVPLSTPAMTSTRWPTR